MMTEAQALDATQRWMMTALIHPHAIAREEIDQRLRSAPDFSAAAGLAIYQRGFFQRITRCMREQFPALCHALGTPLFDDFVADYVRGHPPETYTLYDLGRRFPDYLAVNRPDRDAPTRECWIDFMIDLARFERQIFVMFDVPGHEGKRFAARETPDDALRLQPAFALGAYGFPVAAYYHAVRGQLDPALPPAERSFVALVRTDFVTRTVALSAAEHLFLQAMVTGETVDTALESVAQRLAVPTQGVREAWHSDGGAKQRWIDAGVFIDGTG